MNYVLSNHRPISAKSIPFVVSSSFLLKKVTIQPVSVTIWELTGGKNRAGPRQKGGPIVRVKGGRAGRKKEMIVYLYTVGRVGT